MCAVTRSSMEGDLDFPMLGICRAQLLWCLVFRACSSTGLTQGATTQLGGAPGSLDLCPSLSDCFLHPLLSPMPQHMERLAAGLAA